MHRLSWGLDNTQKAPRPDGSGAFPGHVGVATDVTEVRAAEARLRVLIDELNHRVNNALALAQTLVRQTLREHQAPPELGAAITGRIFPLAATHDVLARELGAGAELGAIVKAQPNPTAKMTSSASRAPGVAITPKTAVALAMALHQLSASAAKVLRSGECSTRLMMG